MFVSSEFFFGFVFFLAEQLRRRIMYSRCFGTINLYGLIFGISFSYRLRETRRTSAFRKPADRSIPVVFSQHRQVLSTMLSEGSASTRSKVLSVSPFFRHEAGLGQVHPNQIYDK